MFLIALLVIFVASVIVNLLFYGIPATALFFALRTSPPRWLDRPLRKNERFALGVIPLAFVGWQAWLWTTDGADRQRVARGAKSPIYKTVPTPDSLRIVVTRDDYDSGGDGRCTGLCRTLILSEKIPRVVLEVVGPDGTSGVHAFQRGRPGDCAGDTVSAYDTTPVEIGGKRRFAYAAGLALLGHCVVDAPVDPLPPISLYLNRASPDRPSHFRQGGDDYHVTHLEGVTQTGSVEVLAHHERYFVTPLAFPLRVALTSSSTEGAPKLDPHLARRDRLWYGSTDRNVLPALGLTDATPQVSLTEPRAACAVLDEALRSEVPDRQIAAITAMRLYYPRYHFRDLVEAMPLSKDLSVVNPARDYVESIRRLGRPCKARTPGPILAACPSEGGTAVAAAETQECEM